MTSQQQLLGRLDAADPQLRALSGRPREVRIAEPPWWPGFQVADVVVLLPHKPVLFRYAVSNSEVIQLGSAESFGTVSRAVGLELAQPQVSPYLRFYIDSTQRGLQVVERADEPLWFASADSDPEEATLKAAAVALIHPAVITPQGNRYHCVLTAIDYRRLLSVVFEVTRDGRVTEVSRAMLMEALPVPYVGV